jgi:hypothetical protein
LILLTLLLIVGCQPADRPADAPDPDASGAAQISVEVESDDPSILKRPFTAEEIREEWIEGLRLLMRRSSPEGEVVERWTVVASDPEGVDIEFVTLDGDGQVSADPEVRRSSWIELRDHAAFPAATSSREWTSRSTALGSFEGWLYRVPDEKTGTVSEFFFVPEFPGAPVQMRILNGEEIMFELEQTARLRPSTG